jgi:hypothetical protein
VLPTWSWPILGLEDLGGIRLAGVTWLKGGSEESVGGELPVLGGIGGVKSGRVISLLKGKSCCAICWQWPKTSVPFHQHSTRVVGVQLGILDGGGVNRVLSTNASIGASAGVIQTSGVICWTRATAANRIIVPDARHVVWTLSQGILRPVGCIGWVLIGGIRCSLWSRGAGPVQDICG